MIYFILPSFNEKDNLSALLRSIDDSFRPLGYRAVLVDDGSTDGSREMLSTMKQSINLEVLEHKINLGLGGALKTGFSFVAGIIRDDDFAVTMDADNTHSPEAAVSMIEKIKEGNDIVIASRFAGGEEIGLKASRKLLSRGARLLLKTFFPYGNVKDYSSGYRVFSGKFLRELWLHYDGNLITEKGFASTLEILLKSIKLKAKIAEVPLILRYDRKIGRSKIKILRTISKYITLIFKMKFN